MLKYVYNIVMCSIRISYSSIFIKFLWSTIISMPELWEGKAEMMEEEKLRRNRWKFKVKFFEIFLFISNLTKGCILLQKFLGTHTHKWASEERQPHTWDNCKIKWYILYDGQSDTQFIRRHRIRRYNFDFLKQKLL